MSLYMQTANGCRVHPMRIAGLISSNFAAMWMAIRAARIWRTTCADPGAHQQPPVAETSTGEDLREPRRHNDTAPGTKKRGCHAIFPLKESVMLLFPSLCRGVVVVNSAVTSSRRTEQPQRHYAGKSKTGHVSWIAPGMRLEPLPGPPHKGAGAGMSYSRAPWLESEHRTCTAPGTSLAVLAK